MGRTKRKTPDRWEQYLPMGKVIEGTRFVAFKTPLKPALSTQIDKKDHFNVSHVILEVARLGCRLGMVVDLTNTDRYYDSTDLTKLGVEYFKLNCPGHEVDGREDIVVKFIQRIEDFLSRHSDEDLLIGVHCTHGINRTGYLISRYLIDRCDWSADAAMGAFEAGRGYAIERGNYVSALNRAEAQRKSGRRRKTWDVVQSDSSDEPKRKKKKKKAKKRSKNDTSTVPDANEMQQMWQMMVGAAQTMLTGAVASPVYGVPAEQQPGTSASSKLEHEDGSAADDGAGGQEEELDGEEDEGDDDYDDGEQEYPVILGEEEAGSSTAGGASKRRRERRKRLQDMFHKMQKGRFWEIREMQKERYGF